MFGAPKSTGTGLFGNQQQNNTQQSVGGIGGFGGQQQQPNQNNANIFGKPATSSSFGQPQQSGGSAFGQSNTLQTQTGSVFGQTAQQPQSGGLFGQPIQNNQTQGSGIFGQANQQPAQQGGLFGQNNNQQPAQQGGLFGQQANNQQPAQQGGLFGQNNQQPAQQGGLFGQNNNQQPPQGGLFGQTNNPQPTQGGLFGQTNNQQTQQGGLFGQNKPQGGLFGGQQQQQQPAQSGFGLSGSALGQSNSTSGGMFGSKPAFGTTNSNSGGMFGNTNNQQPQFQQQQQQQQQQQPVITPFTRPGDLPENFQKELEKMDAYIRSQQQLSEDLLHATNDHKKLVESIPRDVQLLGFKLSSAKETLKHDDGRLASLKKLVDQDYSDSGLLTEVTTHPRKYDRLLPYFNRNIECENRLEQLSLAMRDVKQAVTAEEFGKRITYDSKGLDALPNALKEEYLYFMSLSDRVAELHRFIKDHEEGETLSDMKY